MAVGEYTDRSGAERALIVTESSGTLGARPGCLHIGRLGSALDSVSCTSDTKCIAVGTHMFAHDEEDGLIVTRSDGKWTSSLAPYPQHLPTGFMPTWAIMTEVSCDGHQVCVAAGSMDHVSTYFGLLSVSAGV